MSLAQSTVELSASLMLKSLQHDPQLPIKAVV